MNTPTATPLSIFVTVLGFILTAFSALALLSSPGRGILSPAGRAEFGCVRA